MIYLVRHMETDWNKEGLFTAQAFHIRLNQAGIAEAERMADRLVKVPFRTVYCSDQIRAVETAIIIATRHPKINKFILDQRLREVDVGTLVGKHASCANKPKFSTRHPNFDYSPIGGEVKFQVLARYKLAFRDIAKSYWQDNILVVGHGTALRVYLEDIGVTEKLTRENYITLP